jgi:SAM-dependent methyltransferase
MHNNQLFAGTFFLSISVLMFEITLIRWLSVVVPSNLAFLGVTFALFGVAFGGVLVYGIRQHYALDKFRTQLARYSLSYGIAASVFIIIFARLNFSGGGPILLGLYLIPIIPFTLANICLSLVFKFRSHLIDRLYFFDLVGASLGVLSAILLLNFFSAVSVFFISGLIGLMAACFFGRDQKPFLIVTMILVVTVVGLTAGNHSYNLLDVIYARHGKETNKIFTKWNAFSRISVQTETEPPLVLSMPQDKKVEPLPEQLGIEIDAFAYTPVFRFSGDLNTMSFLRQDLSSLGFMLAKKGHVLIIGPGGGRDVLMGLLHGHRVTGVDINPIIINDLMKNRLRAFSGDLYFHPQVNIVVGEGRSFIHGTDHNYDLIDIPLVDTYAATAAGNLVLVENNLYTLEAFEDYVRHLSEGGILTISRWEFDGMRLVTLFLEASRNLGIRNPEKHIVVVSNGVQDPTKALNNYLFKKTGFSHQEITAIKEFAAANNFSLTYAPGEKGENDYYRLISAQDRNGFIAKYWKNIEPVYDDNPFFFFISPLSGLLDPIGDVYDGGLGNAVVLTAALSALIILVPRRFSKSAPTMATSNRDFVHYLAYFACLGAGFILIEMSLIQKFILFLEKPIYSFSVVIASILLFAGIGSSLSRFINSLHLVNYLRIVGGIVVILLLMVSLLRHGIQLTIGLSIEYKILIALIINAPLSLLMGMLLPLGITRLSKTGNDVVIPWCWAVNGALSVLGSVVAIFLAISFGFNTVLLIGGVIYLLSLVFITALSKPSAQFS